MVGSVTSQGDRALRADIARSAFDIDGSGLKIGVIGPAFDELRSPTVAAAIASGDLPGVGNPNGFTKPVQVLKDDPNGFGETLDTLEVIHDVAPGAELLFHTSGNGTGRSTGASVATAIQTLADAGADIIVDNLGLPFEPFFQDGEAAQAVNEITQRGIAYFSSAGNDGNITYESPFRLSGQTFSFGGVTYETHDFDPSDAIDVFQDATITPGNAVDLVLNWAEPVGNVTSEYGIFLVDRPLLPSGEFDPVQQSFSNGVKALGEIRLGPDDQVPRSGEIRYSIPTIENPTPGASTEQTAYLVIVKKQEPSATASATDADFLKWIGFENTFLNTFQYVNDGSATTVGGSVYGAKNAEGAIAVGAADHSKTPEFGVTPVQTENYSSRGGSPILFDPQGNRLPEPEIRSKPDTIAPTGVETTLAVEQSRKYGGTSAAVPHAAGVAALMLQEAGGSRSLTPEEIREIMQATAVPVAPANNLPEDAGFIQADRAVAVASAVDLLGPLTNLVQI